jgi:hypothetical protein
VTKLTPAFSALLTGVSKGIDLFGKYSRSSCRSCGAIGGCCCGKAWKIAQATLSTSSWRAETKDRRSLTTMGWIGLVIGIGLPRHRQGV